MNLLTHTRIDFLRYRRLWVGISLLASAAGLAMSQIPGKVNLGIDFAGGSQVIVRLAEDGSLDRMRSALAGAGLEAQIQRYGPEGEREFLIRVADAADRAGSAERSGFGAVRSVLEAELGAEGFSVLDQEYVGPQIAAELRRKGLLAVVLSSLGILIYLWLRFELRFAVGTVVAMVHDVLVMLGLYVALGFEFNLTTLAAFLTLVGYSVNDTVVIFDRVRENCRTHRRLTMVEQLNNSLNQTLSRTVLTAGTTLLASGSLLAFAGTALRGFAFVITVGVVVGTYSSIYVASPVVLLWERWNKRRFQRRREELPAPSAGPAMLASQRPFQPRGPGSS